MRTLCFIAALAGCSYTFDDTAPDVRLIGEPPSMDRYPRLNHAPAGSDYLVLGYDDHGNQNAYWVAFTEEIQTAEGKQNGLRAVRLSPPVKEEVILADEVTPGWSRFFLVNRNREDPKGPPSLTIRAAGQPTAPKVFELPGAPGFFGIGYGEEAFLYWVAKPDQKIFFTFRSDGSFPRELPIPDEIDPLDPKLSFFWSASSQYLFTRDPDGQVLAHSTTAKLDLDFGKRPKLIGVLGSESLLTCGDDGLRVVPFSAMGVGTDQVLDPMPCDDRGDLQVRRQDQKLWVYYGGVEELLRVPLDGSAPSEVVLRGGLRPLAFLGDGRIMFSKTPADQFVNAAGDGWLGDWKFMERGLDVGLSWDQKRVRWLEHAAKGNGSGELLSAELGKEPLHLALNTRQYEELADGRVLADANHAFRGTQNRIVVIDEKTRTARWVASAASQYTHIPGTDELLVDVVTGPTGYDIVRVPIPPRDPSDAPEAPPAP